MAEVTMFRLWADGLASDQELRAWFRRLSDAELRDLLELVDAELLSRGEVFPDG